jgi:hypothetical protein
MRECLDPFLLLESKFSLCHVDKVLIYSRRYLKSSEVKHKLDGLIDKLVDKLVIMTSDDYR